MSLVAVTLLLALAAVPLTASRAEPPEERTVVTAVADSMLDRILVRWRTEEGISRYSHFDVLRREADDVVFITLNAEPLGPLQTVAEIESVFDAPGRGDALAGIQDKFGLDYAADILRMQALDAPSEAMMQLRLLPEENYGAALALGKGFLNETVVAGTTYVYEVWGLDGIGARVERIGRATATAGAPEPLAAPANLACVGIGGQEGDMAVFLRWDASPAVQPFFGYEILRAAWDDILGCVMAGSQLAGAVRANALPAARSSPGKVAEGQELFDLTCTACHAGRDVAPVQGSGIEGFRRKQYPLPGCADPTPHNVAELNELDPEQVAAIYDYIQESHFSDDGSATPGDPLVASTDYCYQVAARDLLGKLGTPTAPVICTVSDQRPPAVPKQIQSARTTPAGHEICEISWRRNDDDTAEYRLYRATYVPRYACDEPAAALDTIAQPAPGGGDRVVYPDVSLTPADAGMPFVYALRARDAPGNSSGFSGWVPCTPRDIAAPPDLVVMLSCKSTCAGYCEDRSDGSPGDAEWLAMAGDPDFITADAECLQIDAHPPGPGEQPYHRRLYRCLGDSAADCRSGPDFPELVSPEEDLVPMLDTKTWVMVRGYDRSGNLTGPSNLEPVVIEGAREIPAPRIISARLLDAATNKYGIRFRSIDPAGLIGFALYAKHHEAEIDLAVDPRGPLMGGLPTVNLIDTLDNVWVIRSGAETLDQVLPGVPPPTTPYLIYEGERVYELVSEIKVGGEPVSRPVRFDLVGVGWSGREGASVPFVTSDFELADAELEWPTHRSETRSPLPDGADLSITLTPVGVGGGGPYMVVQWQPTPVCMGATDPILGRPFAVFRRRGHAPRWQQISPLFDCFSGAPHPHMVYQDHDVQEGFWYDYTVVRLGDAGSSAGAGEFDIQHGPSGFSCFDSADPGTCTDPPPE
jgi:mono/diheme cytochrome c family protein